MFDRLKSLFSKREERPAAPPTAPAPAPAAAPAAPKKEAPAAPAQPPAAAAKPAATPPPTPGPRPAAAAPATAAAPGETIALHLKGILAHLPEPLKGQVAHAPGAQVTIAVAVSHITPQLAHGSVKISFAELRALAPAGTFNEVEGQDQTMVDLPLQEILTQLKPTHLQRRAGQKKIEVSEEITALFGAKGEPLTGLKVGSADSIKPAAPSAQAAPAPAPAAATPAAPAPTPAPAPAPAKPAAAPAAAPKPAAPPPPSAPAPAPKPEATAPLKPSMALPDPASLKPTAPTPAPAPTAAVKPETKLPDPASLRPSAPLPSAAPKPPSPPGAATPPLPKPPAAAPPGAPLPRPGPTPPPPSPGLPKPPPPPAPKPAAGTPASPLPKPMAPPAAPTSAPAPAAPSTTPLPSVKPPSAQPVQPIVVVLEEIVASFPEGVRAVATDKRTPGLRFRLPGADVDAGLKRGKVVFTWKQLKPLADPPIDPNLGTEHDDTEVELPLSLIAPLFLAQNKPARPQKKVTVGDNIPDLFGPKPGAAPVASAATAPPPSAPAAAGPAAAPVPVAPAPVAPPPPPPKPNPLGVLFGQPAKYEWTVEEVVQHTAKLSGVGGVLMASKDGLMIASKLAAGQNGETLAAFLPQAFGRMNQYAGDMQLGGLKVLTLHTEQFQVEIHRLGDIYFAVAATTGQTLPSASLQTVAQNFSPSRQP